jgi:hypothetical protein
MALNFVEALEKTAADIKRPPLLPIGTYEWTIKKYEFDKSNDSKWEICAFHVTCTGVGDDVDPDALADFGSATGNYQRLTFLFDTEDRARFDQTLYKLKKFLQDHVKCWDDNGSGSLKEGIANAVGHKFSGVIRWRADKVDPEVQYSEISKTAPIR